MKGEKNEHYRLILRIGGRIITISQPILVKRDGAERRRRKAHCKSNRKCIAIA